MVDTQPDDDVGVARLGPCVAIGALGTGGNLDRALAHLVELEPSFVIGAHRGVRLALAIHKHVGPSDRLIACINHFAGQLAISDLEHAGLQLDPIGVGILLDILVGGTKALGRGIHTVLPTRRYSGNLKAPLRITSDWLHVKLRA